MAMYSFLDKPDLEGPVLIIALSGWVDAGSVGTGAADHLARAGERVAVFDGDALYDYRSNRPVLRFHDGTLQEVTWPALELTHATVAERDVLVLTGSEPDFRWRELASAVVDLASDLGVSKLLTLGGVPAAVPHTLPPPVLATTSDPTLLGGDDQMINGTLVVPGAAVSILTDAIERSGIPSVGYWVQVPHYLREQYIGGVVALLGRVGAQLDADIPMGTLANEAAEQRAQLDDTVAARPEAAAYVQRLEELIGDEPLPSADEIGAEVERFLREATGDDDPFGSSG